MLQTTCCKLSILSCQQVATNLSISSSCNKSVKIKLLVTYYLQNCHNLLKQLAASLWIASCDNQSVTSLITSSKILFVRQLRLNRNHTLYKPPQKYFAFSNGHQSPPPTNGHGTITLYYLLKTLPDWLVSVLRLFNVRYFFIIDIIQVFAVASNEQCVCEACLTLCFLQFLSKYVSSLPPLYPSSSRLHPRYPHLHPDCSPSPYLAGQVCFQFPSSCSRFPSGVTPRSY